MPKGDIETYHEGGQWKNRVEGNQRASNTAPTKKEAEAQGRAMAKERGVEHIVRNMDGKIAKRNSYGNDPHPPKGLTSRGLQWRCPTYPHIVPGRCPRERSRDRSARSQSVEWCLWTRFRDGSRTDLLGGTRGSRIWSTPAGTAKPATR